MRGIPTIVAAAVAALAIASPAGATPPAKFEFSATDVSVDTSCGFPITFTAELRFTVIDFAGPRVLVLHLVQLTAAANGKTATGHGAQIVPFDLAAGTVTLTGTLHLTAPGAGAILLTAGRVVYDLTTSPFAIVFQAGPHEYRQSGLPGATGSEALCAYFQA